jgi:hypothetical protein
MSFLKITVFLAATASAFPGQGHASTVGDGPQLAAHATLPITFTKNVSAADAKPGDPVEARTIQSIHLADGREVPAGARVSGHVLAVKVFKYDNTPYAKQSAGTLDIQIDSLDVQGEKLPLHVSLRAMADPTTSWGSREPASSDNDPLATTTQVGGDLLVPSQKEIRDRNGDVVGYNKRGGQFAHLIANSRGPLNCDGGDTEQPVSLFSASACGLYGFTDVSLTNVDPSHIGLSSAHGTPKIWKHSTALLEIIPQAPEGK